jgi:hypothetical protein
MTKDVDTEHVRFMVCARYDFVGDHPYFNYDFCKTKANMLEVAEDYIEQGYKIEFAGEVKVIKDYTLKVINGE